MPAKLERALKRKIASKNWSKERKDAYVYGTLRKTGWEPSHQKSKKKERELSVLLDRVIEFADPGTTIPGPWQRSTEPESKIEQTQFPAGLSPAAALRIPLPQLMAFLNQRNILQQVFSEKMDRMVKLNSKLDEITFQQDADYKPRLLQRGFLGPGPTILIHGKKGERVKGALQAHGRAVWESIKGSAVGGVTGAGLGASVGAGVGLATRRPGEVAKIVARSAKTGAIAGGLTGETVGGVGGAFRGIYGKRATEIYRQRTGQD
jgi:hypothetical protein